MMRLLYDLGIRLYFLLILVVSPFHRKARLWIRGRRGLLKKIEKTIDPELPLIWFHCSSLGEFEQGRPIIEGIRQQDPGRKRSEKITREQISFFIFHWIPGKMPGGSSACSTLRWPILSNMNSGITC
jgi:hypothetical protein